MKLLFIGNSHTFVNEVPHTVDELFRMSGMGVPDTVMLTRGGMTLGWHSEQPQTWFNIRYGHFDYIVLQDVAHPFIGEEKLLEDVGRMMQFIQPTASKPCLYMTWASVAHPEDQPDMISSYTKAAAQYGALVAPVGCVWEKVRYGYPAINLYNTDGEHAGIYGSYLAACVIFCTLTGKQSVDTDLHDPFYDAFDRKTVEIIHREVKNVLSESFLN